MALTLTSGIILQGTNLTFYYEFLLTKCCCMYKNYHIVKHSVEYFLGIAITWESQIILTISDCLSSLGSVKWETRSTSAPVTRWAVCGAQGDQSTQGHTGALHPVAGGPAACSLSPKGREVFATLKVFLRSCCLGEGQNKPLFERICGRSCQGRLCRPIRSV